MMMQIPTDMTDEQQAFMQTLVLLIESQEKVIEEMQADIEYIKSNLKN